MIQYKWRLVPCSSGGAILVRGDGRHGAHPQTHLQIVPLEDALLIVQAPAMREAIERYVADLDPGDESYGMRALLRAIEGA